jgi:hypothetical protein
MYYSQNLSKRSDLVVYPFSNLEWLLRKAVSKNAFNWPCKCVTLSERMIVYCSILTVFLFLRGVLVVSRHIIKRGISRKSLWWCGVQRIPQVTHNIHLHRELAIQPLTMFSISRLYENARQLETEKTSSEESRLTLESACRVDVFIDTSNERASDQGRSCHLTLQRCGVTNMLGILAERIYV